jgi:hypothetical protein
LQFQQPADSVSPEIIRALWMLIDLPFLGTSLDMARRGSPFPDNCAGIPNAFQNLFRQVMWHDFGDQEFNKRQQICGSLGTIEVMVAGRVEHI